MKVQDKHQIKPNTQSCQTSVMVSADLINKIHNENCLETMAKMPDNFIDLTVTSPPYDGLRTYNGYSFDFESIAKELYRVTKNGGVVMWNVSDATVKGSETGTSFRQALFFKECGFNLHDTMIYAKNNFMPLTHNRYEQSFEYMFVFSKGKPKIFNPIMIDCISKGSKKYRGKAKQYEDSYSERKRDEVTITKEKKHNVGNSSGDDKTTHNAPFPEQLANDHIISWSNENDLIYDCFAGSGTTAKMAILNNRNWIVSEISSEYCEIIKERIKIDKGLFENVS